MQFAEQRNSFKTFTKTRWEIFFRESAQRAPSPAAVSNSVFSWCCCRRCLSRVPAQTLTPAQLVLGSQLLLSPPSFDELSAVSCLRSSEQDRRKSIWKCMLFVCVLPAASWQFFFLLYWIGKHFPHYIMHSFFVESLENKLWKKSVCNPKYALHSYVGYIHKFT